MTANFVVERNYRSFVLGDGSTHCRERKRQDCFFVMATLSVRLMVNLDVRNNTVNHVVLIFGPHRCGDQ